MPHLFAFLPQRRNPKTAEDTEAGQHSFISHKDLPRSLSFLRMQAFFKPEPKLWPPSPTFMNSAFVLFLILTLLSFLVMYGSGMFLARANYSGRQCFQSRPASIPNTKKYKFAMVTCTDGASGVPGRSFKGLMDLVAPNKKSYATRHGYDFIDASESIDRRRPPSWSKILAVRKHLPHYDWIFWNDVDSVVTNPVIKLEDIVSSFVGNDFSGIPDFIVTEDVTGVNAGMFFFRNSSWSIEFLDLWWNQTSFIRPFGESKSGDNAALKYLIKVMPKEERDKHVYIPHMQCIFNSNLWSPTMKNCLRLATMPKAVWRGVYSHGDFMVHLAGLDDKKTWMRKILQDLKEG